MNRGRGYGKNSGNRGGSSNFDRGKNDGGSSDRGGRGNGPPPGLRGKEIGLWYASQQKKKNEEKIPVPEIKLKNTRDLLGAVNFLNEKLGGNGDDSDGRKSPPSAGDNVLWRRQNQHTRFDESGNGTMAAAAASIGDQSDSESMLPSDQDDDDDDVIIIEEPSAEGSQFPKVEKAEECSALPTAAQEPVTEDDDLEDDDLEDEDSAFLGPNQEAQPLFRSASLNKDASIDEYLRRELARRQKSDMVRRLMEFRKGLPATERKQDFLNVLQQNRVVVVSGLTGCGKTTQLPQAVLDEQIEKGNGSTTFIVCTQPRRISAISVAERVAAERGENLKEPECERSVGYQIRLEARLPRDRGSLLYCTTGIVLRWLTSDQSLSRVSHLFLDEIHERDLQSDLLLILVRDLLRRRPDLRIVLMSATLEADTFLNYFSSFYAVKFEIAGRSFPVQAYFLEDIFQRIGSSDGQSRGRNGNLPILQQKKRHRELEEKQREREQRIRALRAKKYSTTIEDGLRNWRDDDERIDSSLLHRLVRHICENDSKTGAILIFVPGWQDIKDVLDQFGQDHYFSPKRFLLLPLHSMIPTSDQQKVFARPPSGFRKIIVSTNIAETSVTIDDVVYVIDSGKIKMHNFDFNLNCQTLKAEWVSKANAIQRQGRAGRCQPGVCYHLFPSWKFDEMAERPEPEMCRTRLTSLCLDVKALTSNIPQTRDEEKYVLNFLSKAVDPPNQESVKLALDDLYYLGALTSEEEMTPLGWQLIKFPVDPHCGKMIIYSALFSCVDPVLTVACCLDYRAPFHNPIGMEERVDECKRALQWPSEKVKSDYLLWVNAYNQWQEESDHNARRFAFDNFLSIATLTFIKKMKRQFAELLYSSGFTSSSDFTHPQLNKNSWSDRVIDSVITAGLYPKVALVYKQQPATGTSKRPPSMRLKDGQRVRIHPMSVNSKTKHFETSYLVYHNSVKSTNHFLHECAMVSPLSLCLAGGRLQKPSFASERFVVDGWIEFQAKNDVYVVLAKVRGVMRELIGRQLDSRNLTSQEIADFSSRFIEIVCGAYKDS